MARTITAGEATFPFEIDDYTRHRLLNGLDDLGITLQKDADIAAYEPSARRGRRRPSPRR